MRQGVLRGDANRQRQATCRECEVSFQEAQHFLTGARRGKRANALLPSLTIDLSPAAMSSGSSFNCIVEIELLSKIG